MPQPEQNEGEDREHDQTLQGLADHFTFIMRVQVAPHRLHS